MELLNTITTPVLQPGQRLLSTDSGFEGAEKYPFPRDCEASIFDAEDNYFYIKKTDVNGASTIRMFKYEEVPIPRFDPKKYVTIDDFDSFKEEMRNGFTSIQSAISNINTNSGKQYTKQGNGGQSNKQNSGFSESSGNV